MPWTETVTMQRLEFIHACQTSGDSFSAVCRHFCISRKTGYKWLKRFQPDDVSSLEDHSRAPLTHSRQHSSDVINCLIRLRRAHPDWGPNKIRQWLLNHEIPFDVPAGSTIGDILKREGLVPDRIKRRKTPENTHALTDIQAVNQVWSADFKGKFRLLSQEYCRPFTLTDNHSRYLLACEASASENLLFTRACFERAFHEYGLPEVVRTDNGAPFAGTGIAGLSSLSVWMIKLGIYPERIKKGHPEQNGSHERMHRSLKAGLSHDNIRQTMEEQQAWFSDYRYEFNHERPHAALGGATPSSVWVPSPRQWDGRVPEINYPEGARLYKVAEKGDIRLGKRLFVSEALRGEYVMLKEVGEELDVVLFDRMILAYYDRAKHSIIRID